jgi:hypothetical protein
LNGEVLVEIVSQRERLLADAAVGFNDEYALALFCADEPLVVHVEPVPLASHHD